MDAIAGGFFFQFMRPNTVYEIFARKINLGFGNYQLSYQFEYSLRPIN